MSATAVATARQSEIALVREINEAYRLAHSGPRHSRRQRGGLLLEHAIRCGELLLTVSDRMSWAQFDAWVATNCSFSAGPAHHYMNLASAARLGADRARREAREEQ